MGGERVEWDRQRTVRRDSNSGIHTVVLYVVALTTVLAVLAPTK